MNKNKFRKIRKNKKAQETLATDILITVSIVLIITISLFVVNMLVGEKKEEKINVNLDNIQTKRELLTMLKTPSYEDVTFGDLLIQHYYSREKAKLFSSIEEQNKATCSLITNFIENYNLESTSSDYYVGECFDLDVKTIKGEEILTYNWCSKSTNEETAYLPLPENNALKVTINTCSCMRSIHKNAPLETINCH
ncbi:hypothetical protein HOC35_05840 [Candidatus Woesearchaeota archaeon]|jgi:hypothetical protein|nr:hypothetical protein [Candidatus Woesearchaeota archaeon]